MKIACISDCHLGYRHRSKTERLHDYRNAFSEAVGKAMEADVDAVLFLGDVVHHSRPDPVTLRSVIKKLIEVAQKKPVVMCIGNHEIEGHLSTTYAPIYSDIHKGISVLTSECPHAILEIDGRKIGFHGFEFMRGRQQAEETLERISGEPLEGYLNILCLHQAVEKYLSPYEISLRVLREVAQKYNLVLIGHVHKHQKIRELEDITPAYYVGSTERVNFNEADNTTGFMLFSDDLRKHEHVGTSSAPMKVVRLRAKSTNAQEVNSEIRSLIEENRGCKLLRIEVESEIGPAELNRDYPELSSQFTILDVVAAPKEIESEIQMEKITLSEASIREYFQKTANKDKELEEVCVNLYVKYGV